MYKKVLIILIIAGVITGGLIGYQRYQVETENRSVEVILDLRQWQKLKLPPEIDLAALLKKYRRMGVTSLAVAEQDLGDLEASGKIKLVTELELELLKETAGKLQQFISVGNRFQDLTYIFYRNPELGQQIEERLSSYLGEDRVAAADKKLLAVGADKEQLVDLSMGFTAEQLDLARQSGLKVVPRFSNWDGDDAEAIRDRFSELDSLSQRAYSQLIFSGAEVLGYPDHLFLTASLIEEYGLKLGIIEPFIGHQAGINRLASKLGPNNIRVHSADQQEFNSLSVDRLVDRYLRAVRERNVRGVYLKPILESKDERSAVELTNQLLVDLTAGLKAEGYSLATAEPISDFSSSTLSLFIINLAVLAALFYLAEYLFIPEFPVEIGRRYKLIFLLVSALISLVSIIQGYILLNRELTALLIAIIFPTLAVVSILFPYIFSNQETEIENRIKVLLSLFTRVSLITLAGGVLLVGALGSWHYLVKIRQFRGIKLSFIGPIILLMLYYLHYQFWLNRADYSFQSLIDKAKELLNRNLKLKDLFLLIFLAAAGIIYIGRTGNQPLIPVPELELIIRNQLEQLLAVRPRFKSFLIGHPLLVVATSLILTGNRDWSIPLLLGGLVGQITLMNTLSHIHTPLWASGLRVSLGLVLGFIIGILLVKLGSFLISWKQKLRKELE